VGVRFSSQQVRLDLVSVTPDLTLSHFAHIGCQLAQRECDVTPLSAFQLIRLQCRLRSLATLK